MKPPPGDVRVLPPKNEPESGATQPESSLRDLALFHTDEGMFCVCILELERGQTFKITLLPNDDNERAMLRSLSLETAAEI